MFGALIIWDLFPASNGYTHILVDVDYVTKWVEDIPSSSADHNTSIKMRKEVIFPRFGVPRFSIRYWIDILQLQIITVSDQPLPARHPQGCRFICYFSCIINYFEL